MKNKRFAIGADIGGSHISCALVDMFEGHIVEGSYSELKIDNKGTPEEILSGWKQALYGTISKVGQDQVAGIGFAMPGPFAYDKGIALFDESVDKFEKLHQVNISSELARRLEIDAPIRFMNDASAFAVGEAWLGEASKVKKSVSITLGTGFGSAFVADGLPVVEGQGIPELGCVWHLPFKDGIGDDYFSTRWCIARWEEITGEKVDGVKPIAELAATNSKAKSLLEEYGSNMGEFLGPWLKRFGAELLVIGGNISGAYQLFGPALEDKLKKQGANVEIAISNLKEDAAIIGGARLIDPDFYEKIQAVLPLM